MNMKIKPYAIGIIYGITLVVALFLGNSSEMDFASVAITISMFVIVGVIFAYAYFKTKKLSAIENDLRTAKETIKRDAEAGTGNLWQLYSVDDGTKLFRTPELLQAFSEYKKEMERLNANTNGSYKCDIDEYINYSLIDVTYSKNIINLIPGTMTGLGILGTFIGLAISLKNFEMGEVDVIIASIPKLMTGLKVAFHTSIYGMLLSLCFSYIHRKSLGQVYIQLDSFIRTYEDYVVSNAEADNTSAIQLMIKSIPESIGVKIADVLTPSLEKMNVTLDNLSANINQRQIEGVSELVDQIMESLNQLLGENFKHLGESIEQTCELQRENGIFMQGILEKIGDMTSNIQEINELSSKTIVGLSSYVAEIEKLQTIVNDNFNSAFIQLEANKEYETKMKEYIDVLVLYEKQIGEASVRFSDDMAEQVKLLEQIEKDMSEETRKNLDTLAAKADEYNQMLSESAKQQIGIVLSMAGEYSEKITSHLDYVDDISRKITSGADESIKTLADSAAQYSSKLAETAEKQISSIITLSNSQTGDMDRAASELTKAATELNGKLIESMKTTFTVFDEELSSISEHLSGTISRINETTGRVPKTVAAAYEGMQSGFKEMEVRYGALLESMEIMNEKFLNIADALDEKK